MPVLETVFFYFFAVGALVSSLYVVLQRNPLYGAIALILDFFFFAGLYVLLSAHFMAVVQVLVYGGAIMVLFVFIIMLLNLREEELEAPKFRVNHVLAVLVGFGFLYFALPAVSNLIDHDAVDQNRATAMADYEQRVADAGEGEEVPMPAILTPSRAGAAGLMADMNEVALDRQYEAQLQRLNAGENPAARKYKPFDPTVEQKVPPILAGKDHRGNDLAPDERAKWGTVEPLSILLVNRFVVPFELTAMLLLAAIVGAVIIAKKRL